jgi:hypothetical protein
MAPDARKERAEISFGKKMYWGPKMCRAMRKRCVMSLGAIRRKAQPVGLGIEIRSERLG